VTSLRVPVWVGLCGVVVVSAAVRIVLVGRSPAPWIMVDELIYSELGKSVASDGRFLVRGVPSTGYGFVYPLLIAPAFRAFGPVPDAYAAAKVINAVVMSTVAIPSYFLARRLLAPWLSVAAAGFAVLIPSMAFTGTLMTENAFYPLFVLSALAIVWMLERPTALRQLAVLGVCALAYATRQQAVALFGAALIAPLLHGLIERDLAVRVRRFTLLYGLTAAGVVVALAGTLARGRSPLSLLGAYRAATGSGYSIPDVARYVLWHAAELDLALGVVGIAALLALWLAPRSTTPGGRAFVAVTLPIVVLVLIEVAAFASQQSQRIEERNDFYLAPFALIALLALVADERVVPRKRSALVTGAVVAGVLPVAIPFARFVNPSAVSDTFGLLPWWWVQDRGIHFGALRFVALAAGLAAASLVFLPRRYAMAGPAVVAVYLLVAATIVQNGRHGVEQASRGGLFAGIRVTHPDWIDRRVGRGADVGFIWHYAAGYTRPLWMNEFFNRSVHTVFTVDGPDPADGGLPETPVHERADGTLVTGAGEPARARYVVSYVDVEGRPLERDPGIGLTLYRVDGPLVVLTRVHGLYQDDTWGGRVVTYRRLDCTGGTLSVQLGTDANLFIADQVVTATVNGVRVATAHVPPSEQTTLEVPLKPDPRHRCVVTFTATIVRVPARVQGGSADTRRLAAHYYAFDYSPR